ncbi:MAG TPA: glycosyltransferase family 2 protein [Thermoanaerobaculia bacterium]|nr:glycosyltransferase family 2 protein [Thermoanaerobaculia bacterium]
MSNVDAIVLDIDGGAMLAECLASLADCRVILFDNGSRVPTPNATQRSETNLGFTGGVNEAFKHVRAEFVALVNNDVVVDRDWLATLLAAMRDPKLAAVQTILRRDANTIDGAGIDISDGTFRQIGHGLPLGTPLPEAWGVSATATVYRVAALGDRVFDPRFFAYYEDVELCARLHEAGWTTRVLPVAKATHRGSQSASMLTNARRLRTRNRYLTARMHRGVGRVRSLLWEDARLALRGKTSLRGIVEGLCSRL